MGILDKVHHLIFNDKNRQDISDFDLKELHENLRRIREKDSTKSPICEKNNDINQKIENENSKIIREVNWVPDSLKTHAKRQKLEEGKIAETLKVSNPPLLVVKMFLAEIPYIIKGRYDLDRNNCLNFAKDVQDTATKRGIRCGLVTIGFHRCPTGHAIVAFETDYGLKFFEPQSANEEDVVIGHRYSATLLDVSEDDIITKVEIFWNDGINSIIE
jgi:hypothetical protein